MSNISVKQVIVIRKDLKMRQGKAVAQGAHASMKAILDYAVLGTDGSSLNIPLDEVSRAWLLGNFRKITVYVTSEEELLALYEKALSKSVRCALITDNGLTEFGGVPTNTAIAIGPALDADFIGLTDTLPLL